MIRLISLQHPIRFIHSLALIRPNNQPSFSLILSILKLELEFEIQFYTILYYTMLCYEPKARIIKILSTGVI